MRALYTLFYAFLLPFIFLRLLFRSIKLPAYRLRWGERVGRFTYPQHSFRNKSIWVHAVSVGETLAAVPLIRRLQQRFPDRQIVVTTMTPTGSEQVQSVFGDTVFHVYAPYDLPGCVNRFLDAIKPGIAVIMETELWPNIINGCYQRGIPVIVANARLSEKSFRGYARFSALSRSMVQQVNCFATQSKDDAARFERLGASNSQLLVTGNIKFDLSISTELRDQRAALRNQLSSEQPRDVWIAASTHRGEDEIILDAYARVLERFPKLLLLLVPRHPERFDEVAKLCASRGLSVLRRSSGNTPESQHQVWLGDTMGELLLLFGVADIAFVGGSLVPLGGHNMIEAAAWELPVITGPSLFNFTEASSLLGNVQALQVCENSLQLAEALFQLLENGEERKQVGKRAGQVVEKNRGALEKLVTVIGNRLEPLG